MGDYVNKSRFARTTTKLFRRSSTFSSDDPSATAASNPSHKRTVVNLLPLQRRSSHLSSSTQQAGPGEEAQSPLNAPEAEAATPSGWSRPNTRFGAKGMLYSLFHRQTKTSVKKDHLTDPGLCRGKIGSHVGSYAAFPGQQRRTSRRSPFAIADTLLCPGHAV